MTRKEQIEAAAKECSYECRFCSMAEKQFIEGAEWADINVNLESVMGAVVFAHNTATEQARQGFGVRTIMAEEKVDKVLQLLRVLKHEIIEKLKELENIK